MPAPFLADDKEPIRFAVIGRKLREELVVRDAGGSRELDFSADPCADFLRDPCRRGNPIEVFGDIEIRLIERQRLDNRGIFGKDLTDLKRDRPINLKPRLNEDQIRAPPLSRDRGHGRVHAELSRFIASRSDDAACFRSTDRYWLSAQLRIVALLYRRVERVHIDVNDFTPGHCLG